MIEQYNSHITQLTKNLNDRNLIENTILYLIKHPCYLIFSHLNQYLRLSIHMQITLNLYLLSFILSF